MEVTFAVRNIMTEEIVSVDVHASLGHAMQQMVDKDIGSVGVTREGEIVGILTERDVLKIFCADPQATTKKVDSIMSHPPVTIDAMAAIGRAADLMAAKKVRRLLVTEAGIICGIITERDLMRATLDVFNKLSDAWV